MSKMMPNPTPPFARAGGYGLARSQEQFVDNLLQEWKFFPPSKPLVQDILRLSESLNSGYLDDEYRRTREAASTAHAAEHDEDAAALEAAMATNKNTFQQLFKRAAAALGVGPDQTVQPSESLDEYITQQQSFISERIYNHLAMLGRTPGTLRGRPYSIRKELTARFAGKIGLGLYKSPRLSSELRREAESVMLRLAGEYQNWLLLKTQKGPLQTTWGYICVSGRPIPEEISGTHPLILSADVAEGEYAR